MRKKIFVLWCLIMIVTISSHSVVWADNQQEELYSAATHAFDDGFYDVSLRYLEQFVQASPQDKRLPQAKFLLAQCYFFKNNITEAINMFKSLDGIYDNKELLIFWMGEAYLKVPDYAQAQKQYELLIINYPDSAYLPQAYYSLGWSYFDQKNYAKAEEVLGQLVKKFPKHQLSEDASLKMAQAVYDAGNYQDALKKFMNYLVNYPQSTHQMDVYISLADTYYYIGDYDNALTYYDRTIKSQDPKQVLTGYSGKIWSYSKLKKFSEAQDVLKEAQDFSKSKNLSEDDLLFVEANMCMEKGDSQKAADIFDQLIKDYPRSPHYLEAHLGRANANFILKKFDDSIGDYSFVIDRGGNEDLSLKANLGIAWSYAKLGSIPQAQERFQKIADSSDKPDVKANASIQMGDVLLDAGKMEDAITAYDTVIKNFPKNSMADYVEHRMAVALLKTGKIQEAREAFEVLKSNFPDSRYMEDVDYYLGLVSFKSNDWKKTVKRMESFLKNNSRVTDFLPEANYILALSYLNLKQPEQTLKIFQKILRLYPEDESVAKNSDIGIAKCQYELGQIKEAVKRFKLIVYKYQKSDVQFEALLWLAQFYLKNSDYQQSLEYYKQILDQFSDHAGIDQIHYEMGQAYEIQGVYDQALIQYKSIATNDPNLSSKIKLAIAGVFAKEFDVAKAVGAYESIATESPDSARESYLKIAQLYRDNQNYDKELEAYQKALAIDAGQSDISNAELLFNMADTYEVRGSFDDAVSEYLKIPAQYPDQLGWVAKAYLRVARIYEDKKDMAGAKVTYQKIVQLNTEESKFAQERLDAISSSNGGNRK